MHPTALAVLAYVYAIAETLAPSFDNRNRSLRRANRGQMQDLPGVIIMIGVAIVAGFTVLYLANEVITILDMNENDSLYESFTALEEATNSAFGLFGFLFILVIMAVGIAYLYRLTNR